MITINLRPGARRQTKRGNAFAGFGERITVITSKVKEPWLAVALASWVLVLGFLGFVLVSTTARMSSLEPKLEAARTEYARYQDFVKQKRREENVRDSILAQIGTITGVDQQRYTWPHILDDIGGAPPLAPRALAAGSLPSSTGAASSISPVAICMTRTALPMTSAGRCPTSPGSPKSRCCRRRPVPWSTAPSAAR
ncbi:MAG: hypothetical protein V4503_04910 [Gemmatimonadota bacterium]